MANAEHITDFIDAIACGVDHFLAGDVTVFSMHDEFAIGFAGDIFHRIESINLGTRLARLAGQCEGNSGRVDIAIQRIPPGTEQTFGIH